VRLGFSLTLRLLDCSTLCAWGRRVVGAIILVPLHRQVRSMAKTQALPGHSMAIAYAGFGPDSCWIGWYGLTRVRCWRLGSEPSPHTVPSPTALGAAGGAISGSPGVPRFAAANLNLTKNDQSTASCGLVSVHALRWFFQWPVPGSPAFTGGGLVGLLSACDALDSLSYR